MIGYIAFVFLFGIIYNIFLEIINKFLSSSHTDQSKIDVIVDESKEESFDIYQQVMNDIETEQLIDNFVRILFDRYDIYLSETDEVEVRNRPIFKQSCNKINQNELDAYIEVRFCEDFKSAFDIIVKRYVEPDIYRTVVDEDMDLYEKVLNY